MVCFVLRAGILGVGEGDGDGLHCTVQGGYLGEDPLLGRLQVLVGLGHAHVTYPAGAALNLLEAASATNIGAPPGWRLRGRKLEQRRRPGQAI